MNKNQSGFSVVEPILLVVLVAIVGGTGWYVYHVRQGSDSSYSSAAKNANSTQISTKKTAKNETPTAISPSIYSDTENGFSFNYEANRKPDVSVTPISSFSLKNVSGNNLRYDSSGGQFVITDYTGATKPYQPTLKAGSIDIYEWRNGDAGVVSTAYVALLKNNKVLTVTYGYNLQITNSDGTVSQPGLTDQEFQAQQDKDKNMIQTLKVT